MKIRVEFLRDTLKELVRTLQILPKRPPRLEGKIEAYEKVIKLINLMLKES